MTIWTSLLPRAALFFLSSIMASATAACSAPPTASEGADPAGSADPNGADPAEPGKAGSDPSSDPAAQETGPLGLVVIDIQSTFVTTASRRNPGARVADVVARAGRLLGVAGEKNIPTFVTYEASKSGDHALAPSLVPLLPPQHKDFIKTTFAATGQPQFLPAIKASGAKRLVVVGAETDVCVMQTMLGLRREGFSVLAVTDGIFTEEVNVAPALRRMKQAGIVHIASKDAEALLSTSGPSTAPPAAGPPVVARPLEMGFVLHDVAGLNATDPNASAKLVRLREMLLVSEWFGRPIFAESPEQAKASLPANMQSLLKHAILPLASKPANVTQLAVAGGRSGIAAAAADLAKTAEVFVVEDALIGTTDLEPVVGAGAVPTTYKGLYYELTQSVDDRQWPSPQWVTDSDPYFDLTKAPEELPPLVP